MKTLTDYLWFNTKKRQEFIRITDEVSRIVEKSGVREGMVLAAVGVALGLLGALVAVRALATVLFEITPWDPLAWIVSTLTLLAVALLASWIPARRALHVDPVTALRGDS